MAAATIEITEARKSLNSMDARLREDRIVVVTRHNRGVFAMVDLDTLASLVKTLDTLANPEAMKAIRESISGLPSSI